MGNPLCHFEFMVSDVQKARTFYTTVFDWQFGDSGMEGYHFIQTGKEPGGGMMAKPEQAPCCALTQYFLVDSIAETLEKATAAGGKTCMPKMEIPGHGWWAGFMDPDGIYVGLFEALKKDQ